MLCASEQDMKNVEEIFHYSSKLLSSESHGGIGLLLLMSSALPIFSVPARQYEEKNFICSQNMSYPFESSANTAGTVDWWQLANKLGRDGRKRWDANAQGILDDALEMLSNEHNDSAMTTAAWSRSLQ